MLRHSRALSHSTNLLRFAASLFIIATPIRAQSKPPDDSQTVFNVQTRPDVDGNLFAIRFLNSIYANWPDLKQDRSNISSWFASTRRTATIMSQQPMIDPDLRTNYADLITYISATDAYLQSLDIISAQRSDQAVKDTIGSLWNAWQTGSDVQDKAKPFVSSENAANAGKIVGTANAIYNLSAKSDARDAVAKNAISVEATRLETTWNAVIANLRASSINLSGKYGWTPGEAGFDGVSSANLADQISRSPRDPFLRVRKANAILDSAKNSNDTVPAINDYLTAARLVPGDSVYNTIKQEFIGYAMEAAVEGAGLDVGASYSAHTMPNANALMASRTYLSVDPDDKTGVGHANIARAFAFAGHYQEAAYSAQAAMSLNQNWKSDPGFCIRYSKIESLNGELDIALAALKHAYEVGYSGLKDVRTNPDFQALRTQRPEQFAALTTLRWGWNIKFGSLVPDDVIIQNNSAFDLTHVKLNVHLRQNQQVWDKQLTCGAIKAGESCTIENAFYVSGSRLDESTANLSSDQN